MVKKTMKNGEWLLKLRSYNKLNCLNGALSKMSQALLVQNEGSKEAEKLQKSIALMEDEDKSDILFEIKEVDIEFRNALEEIKEYFHEQRRRQELELETGGNIRFEEWLRQKNDKSQLKLHSQIKAY
mmetsp:Transcript_19683/g.18754  ORF Transcript_19683/g.18754 Transcript_19683/m.18754 type:complete len:127 (-) Transcript_19683:6-386(-)